MKKTTTSTMTTETSTTKPTSTIMRTENSVWAKTGDACHLLTIFSTVSFALLVGTYMNDPSFEVFDSQWSKDGFCVTNRDIAYWNSHDMCLYVDTAMAIASAVMFLAWRKDSGMENANILFQSGIPGTLMHGVGHGALGKAIRDGAAVMEQGHKLIIDTAFETNETMLQSVIAMLPLVAFWWFLSKASLPTVPNVYVTLAASMAFIRQLWTPAYLGFTYVQTILMLEFSINQLFRPRAEKDFVYGLYPLMVGLPLTLVGWMESTMCSTFVRDYLYGHLVYDVYIVLAVMLWYSIVHYYNKKKAVGAAPTKVAKQL